VAAARPRLQLSAFPNPIAAGGTSVCVSMPTAGPARMAVCDVTGRLVRNLYSGILSPGTHVLPWDRKDGSGRSVPAGIYWIRVTTGVGSRSERLVVLR